MSFKILLILSVVLMCKKFGQAQYSFIENHVEDDLSLSKKRDYGTLTGDVQNWAEIIQNYIIQVINDSVFLLLLKFT